MATSLFHLATVMAFQMAYADTETNNAAIMITVRAQCQADHFASSVFSASFGRL